MTGKANGFSDTGNTAIHIEVKVVVRNSTELCKRSAFPARQEGMDVVAYGQSLHDPDAYYLMRAFDSQEALAGAEARFYSSDGWLSGPRMAIIERIENSLKSVISMPTAAIDALRTQSVNS